MASVGSGSAYAVSLFDLSGFTSSNKRITDGYRSRAEGLLQPNIQLQLSVFSLRFI